MNERASDDRVFVAWFAAIGAAVVVTGVLMIAIQVWEGDLEAWSIGSTLGVPMVTAAVAMLHLAIAIPLFQFLHRRVRVSWAMSAFSGAVIGATPLTTLLLLIGLDPRWPGAWIPSAIFGGVGLVAGLAFRAVLGPQEPGQ